MVEGSFEKDGKKKVMPPGKRKKLQPDEITVLKSWIDGGALPPKDPANLVRELVTPRIEPTAPPRRPILAAAWSPSLKLLALARHGEVELFSPETRTVVRKLMGHRGQVNALAFSADGKTLASAAGEPGLFGEAKLWDASEGKLLRTFEGHRDAIYAIAIAPDGKTLGTGSYDQKIKLWEIDTGKELHTLSAHNGAIFDLAFRPDGKILASASADRTVKLWNVATGKRTDTLSQPLKELYALTWSSSGRRLFAGGIDNRIRVWEVSEAAAETTNPLLHSKFAHEGAILNLVLSPDGKSLLSSADDGTVKLFSAADVTEKLAFPLQSDLAPALAFIEEKTVAVGRLDGALEFYDTTNGKVVPPPAPELSRATPRGFQRGQRVSVTLQGKNLAGVTNVVLSHSKLTGEVASICSATELVVDLDAASDLPRGSYELSVRAAGGESGKLKLHIDDLPQVYESGATNTDSLPASFWGALDTPADQDEFSFAAKAGQTLVLDLAVKSLGSKITSPSVALLDAHGAVLESDGAFDGSDCFIAFKIPADGRYSARVADQMLASSADHFYRLSVGALPVVASVFPLSIGTNTEADLQLIGFNLPANATAHVKTAAPGEVDVPLDPEKFRSRRAFKVLAAAGPQLLEAEPNDAPTNATAFPAPAAFNARIDQPGDVDLFRFEAKAGEPWILETDAARRGSPVDTRIEVLHPDGKPVARLLLQAVRNSAVTFRGIDSVTTDCRVENWEEMELNEFLYLQGEVVKLFRAPQGPDSGFLFYASAGKRHAFFDTSATAHALDEPCYTVEPHPLGAKLQPSGLPTFTLLYQNDDDGERKLGSDSKLTFTAPTNGSYLVRVADTRGHGGDRFAYRLIVREPRPDFTVSLSGANPKIAAGSGQNFTVTAERADGFDGEIRVEMTGVPPGFTVTTPLVIQAGQSEAKGTLRAALDAAKPNDTNASATKVTATASVAGKSVTKDVNNFGKITLGDKPKLWVSLEPYHELSTNHLDPASAISPHSEGSLSPSEEERAGVRGLSNGIPSTNLTHSTGAAPIELTVAPGERIPAWLRIKRNGHEDLVTFFVENLPHGVIVDDIGLNGVLIPKGESERRIFLNAAKWVPEQERWCYAIEQNAGRQTSSPVLLKVRKPAPNQSASSK
jgi:WD40 repeat protein